MVQYSLHRIKNILITKTAAFQGSLEEWLSLLRLEEYLPAFLEQNYQTVDDVAQLTWEDLEEFGIVKLGHQKKIMLAIKRIKDIKAGKRINSDNNRIYATQVSCQLKHKVLDLTVI